MSDGGVPIDSGSTAPLPLPLPDAGAPMLDAGPPGVTWNALMISGDDSITAFDRARETVSGLFVEDGLDPANMIHLSRDRRLQVDGVRDTSVEGIEGAMMDLGVREGEGCVVFMTSHGSRSGFYINGRDYLLPRRLDEILDRACGNRPTVVLISACYSGVFIPDLQAPHRIILTAAREDRTSFGCSAEATYTYWDGCLIEEYPEARTWPELYEKVRKCIEDKEGSSYTPSHPQASFGADVATLPIFHR